MVVFHQNWEYCFYIQNKLADNKAIPNAIYVLLFRVFRVFRG
jgi:hypothetical protein